jgi:probable O-glycosylation ligase (exosortase A-associated)
MAIYGLGSLASARWMVAASCLFLWSDIFQPLEFVKMPGILPVAQIVFAVLVGAFLWHLMRGTFKPRLGKFFWAFCLLMGWILVCAAASPFPTEAWGGVIRYCKYFLPLLLIYASLGTRRDVIVFAAVLAASVGIWACQSGVYTLIHGPDIRISIPGGQMDERNDYTAGIVGTIPMTLFFAFGWLGRFRKVLRFGALGATFLMVTAIFLSLSRGSSLALIAMAAFYIVLISRKKIRDGLLGMVVLAVASTMIPESWYQRMQTIEIGGQQKEASALERVAAMTGAFHATLDRPITGWGPDGWLMVANLYSTIVANPHSIWLKISSETGIVGLAIYVGIIVFTYFRMMMLYNLAKRMRDRQAMLLSSCLITGILGYYAALTFLNAPFNEYLWAWICLAHAWVEIYRRDVRMSVRRNRAADGPRLAPLSGRKGIVEPPPGPADHDGNGARNQEGKGPA